MQNFTCSIGYTFGIDNEAMVSSVCGEDQQWDPPSIQPCESRFIFIFFKKLGNHGIKLWVTRFVTNAYIINEYLYHQPDFGSGTVQFKARILMYLNFCFSNPLP